LSRDLGATIFIVIHVGAEGRNLLADLFNAHSPLPVSIAADHDVPRRGNIYIAPADRHLMVVNGVMRLGHGPRENMSRPAIDPLFRSVAASFGSRAIGVVLTGMLNDGAAGLADIKRCGGLTVVQNPSDAMAPDMPSAALRAVDVDYRAPLADMSALLMHLVGQPAEPTTDVPADIWSEVMIALGRPCDSKVLATLADPVPLTCPDCGGVLSQIRRKTPLRFRCQVGHSYTAEVLSGVKEGALDEAIRIALRIMVERTVLLDKMAADARRAGRNASAASLERRVEQYRIQENVLRQAIEQADAVPCSA
jgi:two-component system chemotaxis response regulator CheB